MKCKFKFKDKAKIISGFFQGHECMIVGVRFESFLLFFTRVIYSVFIEDVHMPEREIVEKHLEVI